MRVQWIGETREVPGHGQCVAGRIFDANDADALSFVVQGLCRTIDNGPTLTGTGVEEGGEE